MTQESVERRLNLSGRSGPVELVILDFPVRHADAPDRFRYAYPDLGAEFMPLLLEQVPRSRHSGPPWRRSSLCGTCGEGAGEPSGQQLQLSVDVERVPPIHVDLAMPGYACGRCGHVSFDVDRSLESHIAEATVAALTAGRIDPG